MNEHPSLVTEKVTYQEKRIELERKIADFTEEHQKRKKELEEMLRSITGLEEIKKTEEMLEQASVGLDSLERQALELMIEYYRKRLGK